MGVKRNSISFYDWCYANLTKEEADIIMLRWDYELNVDKNGNIIDPKNINHGSNGFNKKGYWFKCLDHPEHGSEQKRIKNFIKGQKGSIACNQCNTIATTHLHLIKYLANKEDAYKYSRGSVKQILMKCPDCECEKYMYIYDLIRDGLGCPKCSDGIPYPEKFMLNVLLQLNNNFQNQLSKITFKWCRNYKYDFYTNANNINCIIETHGKQHYEENLNWCNSLRNIQENDINKKNLAKENNIDHYIIIDCRHSELGWIRNSIMNSNLPQLLNFREEDIDWLKCHEAGCKSLVKEVCNLWNRGIKNSTNISNKLKISCSTIRRYLKQGTILGWCDYDGEEVAKNNLLLMSKGNCKKIICLTTKEIFNSQNEANKKYNIQSGSISNCCKGKLKNKTAGKLSDGTKLKWMFYDEYINTNGVTS